MRRQSNRVTPRSAAYTRGELSSMRPTASQGGGRGLTWRGPLPVDANPSPHTDPQSKPDRRFGRRPRGQQRPRLQGATPSTVPAADLEFPYAPLVRPASLPAITGAPTRHASGAPPRHPCHGRSLRPPAARPASTLTHVRSGSLPPSRRGHERRRAPQAHRNRVVALLDGRHRRHSRRRVSGERSELARRCRGRSPTGSTTATRWRLHRGPPVRC